MLNSIMRIEQKRAVLLLVGRYRVMFKAALIAFLGNGVESNLTDLKREGLLESFRFPGGSLAGYCLTAAGARQLDLPPKRADLPRERSLAQSLASLWACCLGAARRHRVEYAELEQVIGRQPPKGGVYLVDNSGDAWWRVYAPSLTTSNATVARQAGRTVETLHGHGFLASWLKARTLGVLVLVAEPERVLSVKEQLAPLTELVRIKVEFAPQPETLVRAVGALG